MSTELYENGPFQVIEDDYNLGSFTIQPTEGIYEPIEVKLQGALTYPSKISPSKLPLIILAHGRHTASIENFRGLLYLAQHLASHGYICVSIDLNDLVGPSGTRVSKKPHIVVGGAIFHRAKTILRTIVELKNHPVVGSFANFKNIGLIGHSRGAEAVVRAGAMSEESGNIFGIKAVLSIAPVDFSGVHLGLPFFLLYGDLDADVSDGQSFRIWDRSVSNKHGFYISGGIHNYFSSNWDNEWENENTRTISRGAHENTAKTCSTAFFDFYLKDNSDRAWLFSANRLPGNLSEIGVSRLYSSVDQCKIDSFEGGFDPTTNSLGLPVLFQGSGEILELDLERFKINTDGLKDEISKYYQYNKYLIDPNYEENHEYIRNELSRMGSGLVTIFKYFFDASHQHTGEELVRIIQKILANFTPSPSGWESFERHIISESTEGLLDIEKYIEANSSASHSLNQVGKGLLINWSNSDATYKSSLESANASLYRWLSFRVGQVYDANKNHLLNPVKTKQSFSVALTDKDGRQALIKIADADGEIDYPKDDQRYFKSSLQTLLIPIALFLKERPDLDTKCINDVQIFFNQIDSGSLVIDDISFVN